MSLPRRSGQGSRWQVPEGRLVVCATPIGNLDDSSDRLRYSLREADVVYAEDTRRTGKLLRHLGATPPVRSLFEGNEAKRTDELIADLRAGKTVALVSDAGMPTVSDPGARAVARAHEEGLTVTVVPGPSAVTSAITLAGFGGDRFVFEGFLPRKGEVRARRLAEIAGDERPVVLFASPNRLIDDLRDLETHVGGNRRVAVARELTKLHEEVWVGALSDAVARWDGEVKGEVTLVVEGGPPMELSESQAVALARSLIAEGHSLSEAARRAAEETGVARRAIYQVLLSDQGVS